MDHDGPEGAAATGGIDDGPVTVLIVDDEPGLADLYAAWLGDRYDTVVTYGGEAAIEALSDAVDVVLLDRRMYDVSGDDVLEEIERRDFDPAVAMVTAVEPDFDLLGMGFDDYLMKPVSQDDLVNVIESMLAVDHYGEAISDLYGLQSKRIALEEQKAESELAANEEYQRLLDRIDQLQSEADAVLERAGLREFKTLFRQIEGGTAKGGAG